ncbi:MAG: hypothetical protein ACRDTC_23140 [Pseudonocardiaceae bacterium]
MADNTTVSAEEEATLVSEWITGLIDKRTKMRYASLRIVTDAGLESMTKAITVRLDEADHAALTRQADQLGVRPGTLARMLLHAGLTGDTSVLGCSDARDALKRLVRRSRQRPRPTLLP